jgi:hypothetical protein
VRVGAASVINHRWKTHSQAGSRERTHAHTHTHALFHRQEGKQQLLRHQLLPLTLLLLLRFVVLVWKRQHQLGLRDVVAQALLTMALGEELLFDHQPVLRRRRRSPPAFFFCVYASRRKAGLRAQHDGLALRWGLTQNITNGEAAQQQPQQPHDAIATQCYFCNSTRVLLLLEYNYYEYYDDY